MYIRTHKHAPLDGAKRDTQRFGRLAIAPNTTPRPLQFNTRGDFMSKSGCGAAT